jgi:RNA polymerase sigma-70 factor (ECF subfamily)
MHEAGTLEDQDFDALYRGHADRLWRSLLSYTGDPEIASDATSEAFAQCLARGAQIRSPAAWIWRAAFRIAAGQLEETRRTSRLTELKSEVSAEGPRDSALLPALAALPARQRAALILYYYVGFNTREIAAILDTAAPTIRVHLNRGRRRLRRMLEEEKND